MDIASLPKYTCWGRVRPCRNDLPLSEYKDKFVKFEDVMELLKQADNRPSAPLCDCELLFIGCANTGGNCKTRGLTKCR